MAINAMSNTALIPSHFEDAVASLIVDWQGQDEMFYHDKAQLTIYWYCGKVRSLEEALRNADIRAKTTQFMTATAQGYGIELRRLQEAREVYRRFYKPSDSLKETCERIFQEAGSWSKALPPKPEKQEKVEPVCDHKCSIHQ